jgi:hypothetical protein
MQAATRTLRSKRRSCRRAPPSRENLIFPDVLARMYILKSEPQLGLPAEPTLLPGEKGFGNEKIMREAELRALAYLFKLR